MKTDICITFAPSAFAPVAFSAAHSYTRRLATLALALACTAAVARAEKYYLLVGKDALHYPGAARNLFGPGGIPGPVYDGDRLAGTADVGPVVQYMGTGTPMYAPNHLGSLSFLFRRGTIPYAGGIPILGVEFLGGPLLDLDGDPNPPRSLIPVPPARPVEIPGTDSFIDLTPNPGQNAIALNDFDATGCNEGGPGVGPDIATILVTIAGTTADGGKTGPINPGIDTRTGTLTPFTGSGGTLAGVWKIANLGFEIWEDTIDATSSSADVLGTMQFLGTFKGWLVERSGVTHQFPALAGQGLGATRWPDVDTAHIGQTFNTANGLAGGNATIAGGSGGDDYAAAGNGGLPLTDFGGDLGAYLDAVVVPRVPGAATRFVYLESAGFGINNSNDPVFTDTIAYDVVLLAANATCGAQLRGDSNCDGHVDFGDINCFVAAMSGESEWQHCGAGAGCTYICANDANGDGRVDFGDINAFVALLSGQ